MSEPYLIALHDHEGTILAAVLDDRDAGGGPDDTEREHPLPMPVAGDGQSVVRVQLDPEHAGIPLDELCTLMRIDPHSGGLEHIGQHAAD
jgi:hypothetical protein